MKSLTTEQSQLLSQLVDANYDADNTDNDYDERDLARQKYYELKIKLINNMGMEAYNELMETGHMMFA
jgi:hypothetical protein